MHPANRGDEFIELYNRLDAHLRSLADFDHTVSFMAVVDALARHGNAVIRSYKDNLREFGELRNAIVHDRVFPTRIIAEPLPEVLAQLHHFVHDIIEPEHLIPRFQRTIRLFRPNDPLTDAIQHLHDHHFSQAIVFDRPTGVPLQLLTAEGITFWLGSKLQDDIISVREARVSDVLPFEPAGTYAVMARTKTVHDAHDHFASALVNKRPRIFAILITQTGKRTETPIGIVTPWDLMV